MFKRAGNRAYGHRVVAANIYDGFEFVEMFGRGVCQTFVGRSDRERIFHLFCGRFSNLRDFEVAEVNDGGHVVQFFEYIV